MKTPTNQNLNDYRSVEFSGLVAPENCREYGFGYGVVYLTKNDMATLKQGFIFINPYMKVFLRSFFFKKSDLSRSTNQNLP